MSDENSGPTEWAVTPSWSLEISGRTTTTSLLALCVGRVLEAPNNVEQKQVDIAHPRKCEQLFPVLAPLKPGLYNTHYKAADAIIRRSACKIRRKWKQNLTWIVFFIVSIKQCTDAL